jgi:hypothetical protein
VYCAGARSHVGLTECTATTKIVDRLEPKATTTPSPRSHQLNALSHGLIGEGMIRSWGSPIIPGHCLVDSDGCIRYAVQAFAYWVSFTNRSKRTSFSDMHGHLQHNKTTADNVRPPFDHRYGAQRLVFEEGPRIAISRSRTSASGTP